MASQKLANCCVVAIASLLRRTRIRLMARPTPSLKPAQPSQVGWAFSFFLPRYPAFF